MDAYMHADLTGEEEGFFDTDTSGNIWGVDDNAPGVGSSPPTSPQASEPVAQQRKDNPRKTGSWGTKASAAAHDSGSVRQANFRTVDDADVAWQPDADVAGVASSVPSATSEVSTAAVLCPSVQPDPRELIQSPLCLSFVAVIAPQFLLNAASTIYESTTVTTAWLGNRAELLG